MTQSIDDSLPVELEYFAWNLRAARMSAGFNQKQFAEHIGIAQCTLSEYERGMRALRLTTMVRLADGVNKPLWLLLQPRSFR